VLEATNNFSFPNTNILAVQANSGSGTALLYWAGNPIPVGDTLLLACEDAGSGTSTLTASDDAGNIWVALTPNFHWNTSSSPARTVRLFWVQSNVQQETSDHVNCLGGSPSTRAVAWQFHSPTGTISMNVSPTLSEHDGQGAGGVTTSVTPSVAHTLLMGYWSDPQQCSATDFSFYDISPASVSDLVLEAIGDPTTGTLDPDANCYLGSNYIVAGFALAQGATVVLATVTTTTASGITSTTATAGGTVTNAGGGTITQNGTCYDAMGVSGCSTVGTTCTSDTVTSVGMPFVSNLSALSPLTTYHYCAYAINQAGTGWGTDQTFATLGAGSYMGAGVRTAAGVGIK